MTTQFRPENYSSCVFATQGNKAVFDIEDFGNYSHCRRDSDNFPMDYSYYETKHLPLGQSDVFGYNNCDTSSMYSQPMNCPMDYEIFPRQYGDDCIGIEEANQMRMLCPVRSNSLFAGLPCKGNEEWDYNQCFSYYANGCYNTCQFVNVVDIEDFM